MNKPVQLDIRPLTPALGAEVFGIDLSAAAVAAADRGDPPRARRAPGHLLSRPAHELRAAHRARPALRIAARAPARAGQPPGSSGTAAHPRRRELRSGLPAKNWHTDVSCEEEPPMGSMLYLTEVPPSGGDTMFASMYAAYDALSRPMQQFLEGLTAVHDGAKVWTKYGMTPSRPFARNEHPMVAVHPETGRKLLFVNKVFTIACAGAVGQGERRAARDALPAHREPALHVPLQVAGELRRVLGQPLHAAPGDLRLLPGAPQRLPRDHQWHAAAGGSSGRTRRVASTSRLAIAA